MLVTSELWLVVVWSSEKLICGILRWTASGASCCDVLWCWSFAGERHNMQNVLLGTVSFVDSQNFCAC